MKNKQSSENKNNLQPKKQKITTPIQQYINEFMINPFTPKTYKTVPSRMQSHNLSPSNLPIADLQSHLLNLWTSYSVDETYQNLFLVYIETFTDRKQQIKAIQSEIKKTYEKSSLYFLLQENLVLRAQIKQQIEQQLQKEAQNFTIKKSSQKLQSVLKQLCDKLKNLRRINLLISENILKIFEDFKVTRQSSLGSIGKKYIQFFMKIDVENEFIKQSFLSEYIMFQKGYDPFFLVHYEQIMKSPNPSALKKHQPVSQLFDMNISYVYRLMRAQQKMLKYMLLIDDHNGNEKERKEIINRQRMMKLSSNTVKQKSLPQSRGSNIFLPSISKHDRNTLTQNSSAASTIKPIIALKPRRPFQRKLSQEKNNIDDSQCGESVRKKIYSLKPVNSDAMHSQQKINGRSDYIRPKNQQRNHSLDVLRNAQAYLDSQRLENNKNFQTEDQPLIKKRPNQRYAQQNTSQFSVEDDLIQRKRPYANSQSQRKWNIKKGLKDRRHYLRPIKTGQTEQNEIIEEGQNQNSDQPIYFQGHNSLDSDYPMHLSVQKSKLANTQNEEKSNIKVYRSNNRMQEDEEKQKRLKEKAKYKIIKERKNQDYDYQPKKFRVKKASKDKKKQQSQSQQKKKQKSRQQTKQKQNKKTKKLRNSSEQSQISQREQRKKNRKKIRIQSQSQQNSQSQLESQSQIQQKQKRKKSSKKNKKKKGTVSLSSSQSQTQKSDSSQSQRNQQKTSKKKNKNLKDKDIVKDKVGQKSKAKSSSKRQQRYSQIQEKKEKQRQRKKQDREKQYKKKKNNQSQQDQELQPVGDKKNNKQASSRTYQKTNGNKETKNNKQKQLDKRNGIENKISEIVHPQNKGNTNQKNNSQQKSENNNINKANESKKQASNNFSKEQQPTHNKGNKKEDQNNDMNKINSQKGVNIEPTQNKDSTNSNLNNSNNNNNSNNLPTTNNTSKDGLNGKNTSNSKEQNKNNNDNNKNSNNGNNNNNTKDGDNKKDNKLASPPLLNTVSNNNNPTNNNNNATNNNTVNSNQPKTSQQQSKIKIIPGKLTFQQFSQYIKSKNIHPAYKQKLKSSLQFILKSAQKTQAYLNEFHLNDQLAIMALCSPTSLGNLVIYLWAPIENICDEKQSLFFFKKYLDYLQNQTTFKSIMYCGQQIPQLKNQSFEYQKDKNYLRKRVNPIKRQKFQFQYFFSMQATNINFVQQSLESLLYSDQITPFSQSNSWCNSLLLMGKKDSMINNFKDQWEAIQAIKSISEANQMQERDSYDTFEVGQEKIKFQNINMTRCMLTQVPKYGFIANEGYMIVTGKALTLGETNKKVCKISLLNDISLYFGNQFKTVEEMVTTLQKNKQKAKQQETKFAFKMFSKQLYGKYSVKDEKLEKNKAFYCNWDLNFAWRDQIPGKIIHDLNSIKHKYGSQSFMLLIQMKGEFALGAEILKQDFLY